MAFCTDPGIPATALNIAWRARGREGAVEAEQQILLALPDEAADAEHLAATELDVDVAHHAGREARDRNDRLAIGIGRPRRKEVAGIAADHQLDEAGRVDAAHRAVGGHRAVLEDGDVVAEAHHFVEPVRDVEDGDPLLSQPVQELGQRVGFVRRERRGRLVEDEHPRLAKERLGDLHHLAPAERQVADGKRKVFLEPDQLAGRAGAPRQRAVVDEAEAARIGAKTDVLGDRELAGEAQFLLDDGDAGAARLGGVNFATPRPSISMVPLSGTSAPDRRLISVDLPAPFSPRRA